MLTRWPIRNKLLVGITLLLVIVVTLSVSGFRGVYAYRGLVKSLRARADELPLATTLLQQISDLRAIAASARSEPLGADLAVAPVGLPLADEQQFALRFEALRQTLHEYRANLLADEADDRIGDIRKEAEIAAELNASLARIETLISGSPWAVDDVKHSALVAELAELQRLATELPSHLHRRLGVLAGEVRIQYRSLIAMLAVTTLSAAILLTLFIRLFYRWVFQPLAVLVTGSRRVAGGDFNYRIELAGRDEMGELAEAMNDMTARFRAIRDDLDRQVQIRTKQVVRSEQLASVGFLAAGVAHEINNPLASIAMCAESLEGRLAEFCSPPNPPAEDGTRSVPATLDDSVAVMQQYLRMIQSEAFRCKGITEKLLDFSRIGEVKHQSADLRELVEGVIEMVRHLGKYQDRKIVLVGNEQGNECALSSLDGARRLPATESAAGGARTVPAPLARPIYAAVNVQEFKQVVLNLITNALDSLDTGGTLEIRLAQAGDKAELLFRDNGCGMTEEVLAHLFEPFFTRKRGGQGTGLGLSIVYRIVTDHGGQIEAESEGPGRGSQFRITLPLARPAKEKERNHRYQAA